MVDDEPMLLRAIARELRGFEVIPAATLAEAIAVLDAGPLDAVVTDFHLGPRDRGLDVLVAARERQPSCPRILMTGSMEWAQDAIAEAEPTLIQELVEKPWTPGALAAAVRSRLAAAAPADGR